MHGSHLFEKMDILYDSKQFKGDTSMTKYGLKSKNFYTLCIMILLLIMTLTLCSCSKTSKTTLRNDFDFSKGKMFHTKQILEHYDVNGDPMPQYLEFWITQDKGKCIELDEEGNFINVTLDNGKTHIQYDPLSLDALESTDSLLFVLNYDDIAKLYSEEIYSEAGEYADRPCDFYFMENETGDQWIKIYVDAETGYTLFSDHESFRLRTALFEEVPIDETLFKAPKGLNFKGGK